MKLLDRLNLWKRIGDLERERDEMFTNIDGLITGVEAILESMDREREEIALFNQRIRGIGTIDLSLKADWRVT